MFNGYIFDWDNTLVDSFGVIKTAVSLTLDSVPYTGDYDEIMSMVGVGLSLREGFPLIFGDRWHTARDVFYTHYEKHIPDIEKKDGFDRVIAFLKETGSACAINSNKEKKYLRQEVAYFGIQDVFSYIVGAGDMKNDKPSPDGALYICEQWGTSDNVCYVGDSGVDVTCAQDASLASVVIGENKDAIAKVPDYIYPNLSTFVSQQINSK